MDDEEEVFPELDLQTALRSAGASYAEAVDGDVWVEWYLTDLLEFCRDWRSEIEDLG